MSKSNLVSLVLLTTILITCINSLNFETSRAIIHRPSFSKSSNFGFSVAGYKVDNDPWIIVGAPLTARDRMHDNKWIKSKEGAIYRCRIDKPGSCYMLPFDIKDDWNEARDQYGIYYSENKTNQLLGATLKVSDDIIMACAPNYRHVTRILRQNEFREEPTGICYILREKMRKFEEHSPCRNSLWGHHRQGYCQAGFSAAISKNDSSLFISGPGAWYWQGMVFSINLYNKDIRHRFPSRSGEGKYDDSYRGYAIDTGHFDNDVYEDVIISAPRGFNCKGSVEIFSSRFRLLYTFYGKQIGAYFGSALAAVDLNNDLYDDIIIGSPMYQMSTDKYDVGRVDIYVRDRSNFSSFVFKHTFINGFRARSRFGSTITKLGDVNDDGFNDVAIAAPYDGEDESGIVYIFKGTSNGLDPIPIQIIKGSDFNLKTFGYSMSGGVDLDGNQYPDLIIGAYKSDAVVYVRSRAVIQSIVSTQTTPKVIDLKSVEATCIHKKDLTCMDLQVCVRYFGKAVPSKLTMQITIELDIEKNQNSTLVRAFFNETNTALMAQNFTFDFNNNVCFSHMIHVKKNVRDKFEPVRTRVNLTLPRSHSERELTPLFKSEDVSSQVHEIRFLRNCGADDICKPDLKLYASSPSLTHVYGSTDHIDLNIKVINELEDAFEAQCYISLPFGVDYVKAFISHKSMTMQTLPCRHNKTLNSENETTIICDIGNPLTTGSSKNFTIRVSPQNILLNKDKLKFNISVTSSNKEDEYAQLDNEKYVYVVMKASPSITLLGKQYHEQVVYNTKWQGESIEELFNETQIGPEIIHEYKIINKGPSEILLSEMIVSWQKRIKIDSESLDYLYLMEEPYTEGPISCQYDANLVNPMNISRINSDHLKYPEQYYSSAVASQRMKRHFQPTENLYGFGAPNKLINLNNLKKINYFKDAECSFDMTKSFLHQHAVTNGVKTVPMQSSFAYHCGSVHCNVETLKKDESALIRLRFRIWARNLAKSSDVYKIKTFAMSAVTKIPYTKIALNLEKFRSSTQIATVAYPKERRQFLELIDMQIVFLSVITGIVLLVVSTGFLWCCGFFKRFEPEEMKKLEDSSTSDEEVSNDVIDISKDCGKVDIEKHEKLNLMYSNDQQQKSPDIIYSSSASERMTNAHAQAMFANQYNQFNNMSPSHHYVNNQANSHTMLSSPKIQENRRQQIIEKSEPNDSQFSTFQANPLVNIRSPSQERTPDYHLQSKKDLQKELLMSLKNQIEANNSNLSVSRTSSPKVDDYTTKLPPVPRRNSKSSLYGRTRTMSPLSNQQNALKLNQHKSPSSPRHQFNSQIVVSNINANDSPSHQPGKKNFYQKI